MPLRTLQESLKEAADHLITIQDMIRFAISEFNRHELFYGHGTESSLDDAVALILGSLALPPDLDPFYFQTRLLPHEKIMLLARIERRITEKEPVAYLISESYFAGFSFYVDKRVLIPRSPIAEIIEEEFSPWIDVDKIERILDIGTGSGCIAIASALFFGNAVVDAVDISPDALVVAKINVDRYDLNQQVRLIESDLFEKLSKNEQYDVIIANPPYVPSKSMSLLPSEYLHEPQHALDGGSDGLKIVDKILVQAIDYLTPHGILIVEVGEAQSNLEAKYPSIPFTWLQFARGGDGIFLLTREELMEHQKEIIANATI
jgi:ribosomal protein L3 glutamine methyltransferase